MNIWDEIDEITNTTVKYWDVINKLAKRMYEFNQENNNGNFNERNIFYLELVDKLYGITNNRPQKTDYHYTELVDYIEINGKDYALKALLKSISKTAQNYDYEKNDNFKNYFFDYLKIANRNFHSKVERKFKEDIASEILGITKEELKARRGVKSLSEYMKEIGKNEEFKKKIKLSNPFGPLPPEPDDGDDKPKPPESGENDPGFSEIEKEPYIVILSEIIKPLSDYAISINVTRANRIRFRLIYTHDSIGTILTENYRIYIPYKNKLFPVFDRSYIEYIYIEDEWDTIEKLSKKENIKSGIAFIDHRKVLDTLDERGTFIQDLVIRQYLSLTGSAISQSRKIYEEYIKTFLQKEYS